jgi:hypothetical protein
MHVLRPASPAAPPVTFAWSAMMASTVLCMGHGTLAVQLIVAVTCGTGQARIKQPWPVPATCKVHRCQGRSQDEPAAAHSNVAPAAQCQHLRCCLSMYAARTVRHVCWWTKRSARIRIAVCCQSALCVTLPRTLTSPLSVCSILKLAGVTNLELPGNCAGVMHLVSMGVECCMLDVQQTWPAVPCPVTRITHKQPCVHAHAEL